MVLTGVGTQINVVVGFKDDSGLRGGLAPLLIDVSDVFASAGYGDFEESLLLGCLEQGSLLFSEPVPNSPAPSLRSRSLASAQLLDVVF